MTETERLMQQIRELLETREAFRAWLRAGPAARHVGQTKCSGVCPVATWLMEATGAEGLDVTHKCVGLPLRTDERKRVLVKMPPWAAAFVKGIDGHKPMRTPITAGEALDVLNAVP